MRLFKLKGKLNKFVSKNQKMTNPISVY